MKVRTLIKTLFFLPLLFLMPNSCKEKQEYIPYVPVNFTVDLSRFNNLTSTGYSQKYEYDGYAGVIVYCEYYDVVAPSNSMYYAYDAACTFEVNDSCSVVNENNGINAVCPCCGSGYSLFNGYPQSGDAEYPLKEYNVVLIDNKLHISN